MKPFRLLVIFNHPRKENASTILEHVYAFSRYSENDVDYYNCFEGQDSINHSKQYDAIIYHYSLFGSYPFRCDSDLIQKLLNLKSRLRIAFFQDEYQHCQERFKFIKQAEIDVIFSLLEPRYFAQVYTQNSGVESIYHTLTGYVDRGMVEKAAKALGQFSREIDVGYRARTLPYYMGEGAQEKVNIGKRFLELSNNRKIRCDIAWDEGSRLYGQPWHKFLASCKGMLGVESGTSIFDLNDEVKPLIREELKKNPEATFEEVQRAVLLPFEGQIFYRCISPRIFEYTAHKTCMILFEGDYQGVVEPDVHYIMLKKDFSNYDDVVDKISDDDFRMRIVENAYGHLIDSHKFDYSHFIEDFDNTIAGHLS